LLLLLIAKVTGIPEGLPTKKNGVESDAVFFTDPVRTLRQPHSE